MINFETYHEVRRLSRELNLTPTQIAGQTSLRAAHQGIQAHQQAGSLQRSDRLLAGKTSLYRNADLSTSAL